ncbi:MAG: MerR family transcriptional regulator [Pseudomonadota bacterium]
MDKSPNAFRTISEVSETLDVPAHVLRFWESKFPQVKPVKRGGGRRYYRPDDVTLLTGIRELLYEDGLTIKGVQKIFREKGVKHVTARGAELSGDPAPAVNGAGAASAGPAETAPAETTPTPEPSAPEAPADAERVQAAIAKLEALRDRLRRGDGDPGAAGDAS